MNQVTLIGSVGKDPEVKHLKSGHTVASFSLATNDGTKDKPNTNWHNVKLWDKAADIAEKYIKKGSKVAVSGRIDYSSFEGNDGSTKHFTDIVGFNIELLSPKDETAQPQRSAQSTNVTSQEPPWIQDRQNASISDDDLPF